MRRLAAICIMALAVTGSVDAGSIYKCTDAAGNVTFSQTACPAKSSGEEVGYSAPSQRPSSNQAGEQKRSPKQKRHTANPVVQSQPQASPPHYQITPMEQLEQIERDKEKRSAKRRQWHLDQERRLDKLNAGRSKAPTSRKEVKIDRAKCDYYKAKARRYEYKNEELHAWYNLQAAETCR